MDPHTGLNNLDYIVLGIVLLSGLFALMRGFIREIFSLIAWVGAYFAAAKYHHLAEPFIQRYIHNQALITPVAAVAVFIVVFIILTILGMIASRFMRHEALDAIDRSLGFIFGILRGVIVVSIVYLMLSITMWPDIDKPPEVDATGQAQPAPEKDPNRPPDWVMQAKTRPAMAYGAHILKDFIPQDELQKTTKSTHIYLEQQIAKEKAELQKAIDQKALDMLSTPTPAGAKEAAPPSYDDKNRSGLDQLINQKGK